MERCCHRANNLRCIMPCISRQQRGTGRPADTGSDAGPAKPRFAALAGRSVIGRAGAIATQHARRSERAKRRRPPDGLAGQAGAAAEPASNA